MKEPDLEENALRASVSGDELLVERQSLVPDETPVTVTAPDGSRTELRPDATGGGRSVARMKIEQPGLYRVEDGTRTAIAAAGPPNPIESMDVRATPERSEEHTSEPQSLMRHPYADFCVNKQKSDY